jgi:hypothetical protein
MHFKIFVQDFLCFDISFTIWENNLHVNALVKLRKPLVKVQFNVKKTSGFYYWNGTISLLINTEMHKVACTDF